MKPSKGTVVDIFKSSFAKVCFCILCDFFYLLYFFRYDSVDSPKALTALKYMLLSKIMLRTPEDVQTIMSGKLAVKYAGLDLDAMRAVAEASHRRSLADFQKAVKQYRQQLEDDVIVRAHLGSLYDAMLEQNLCRLVEPYSRVQVCMLIYMTSPDQHHAPPQS